CRETGNQLPTLKINTSHKSRVSESRPPVIWSSVSYGFSSDPRVLWSGGWTNVKVETLLDMGSLKGYISIANPL
ncbi:hypothetical protein BYT27DRAFT_7186747, partial [Phlegmacium glaucopus]